MSAWITALRLVLLSIAVCCVAYPAAVLGFAAVATPETRQGSLLRDERGAIVGSRLIAQDFTRAEYFWPRPSAVNFDASATGGSNLSPTNPALTDRAREIVDRLEPKNDQLVPVDLVSASGSGLDPHITLSAALLQVPRVAAARNLPEDRVEQLVNEYVDSAALTALGGERLVNVLELNLALDQAKQ